MLFLFNVWKDKVLQDFTKRFRMTWDSNSGHCGDITCVIRRASFEIERLFFYLSFYLWLLRD